MKLLWIIYGAGVLHISKLYSVISKFIFQSPEALKEWFPEQPGQATRPDDKSGIIHESYANFGLIPYGHSMVSFLT